MIFIAYQINQGEWLDCNNLDTYFFPWAVEGNGPEIYFESKDYWWIRNLSSQCWFQQVLPGEHRYKDILSFGYGSTRE